MRLPASALAVLLLAPAALAQRMDVPGDESVNGNLPADDLRLAVSAEAHGLSGAGLFDRGADPLRMLQNPALLADADGLTLAASLTPDYLALDAFDLESGAVAYPLALPTASRPLAIVLGASTTRFDYGALGGDAEGIADRASTVALGVGWNGGAPIRAGVGVRTLTSAGTRLASGNGTGLSELAFRSSAVALDLGADVTLPVSAWIRPTPARGPRVAVDVTAGAALRGLTVSRTSRATLDGAAVEGGFPVEAESNLALGTSARLGLDVGPSARPFRVVEVAALADLAAFESATQTLLGARVTLFEALALRVGSIRYGTGFRPPTSVGVGVSGGGLLRALGARTGNRRLVALGTRVDLRYDFATQPSDVPTTTVGNPEGADWQTHTLRLRLR